MRKPDLEIFREALQLIASQTDENMVRRDVALWTKRVAQAALSGATKKAIDKLYIDGRLLVLEARARERR